MPRYEIDREKITHHSLVRDEAYLEAAVILASTAGKLLDASKQEIASIEEQATRELSEDSPSYATEPCMRNIGRIAALRDNGIIE
jgi:hypothetical protein